MRLYLIRHGQSYVNLPNWEGGYVDAGLTDLGQQQAGRVADWLAQHVRPTAMYASTMRRAQETAAHIAQATGLHVVGDDRLREVGNCYPDASPVPLDPPPVYADFWATQRPFSPTFAHGESWLHFVARVGSFLHDVTARHTEIDDAVLVVCHGGVINAAMDVIFGVGPWRRVDIWVRNTGINDLEYLPGAAVEPWRLHGVNLCYHLLNDDGSFLE